MAYNRASGILTVSSEEILAASPLAEPPRVVDVLLSNPGGNVTVEVFVSVLGGTQRRIAHAELATEESLYLTGVYLDCGDSLYGSGAVSTTYVVQPSQAPCFGIVCIAANGGIKQGA